MVEGLVEGGFGRVGDDGLGSEAPGGDTGDGAADNEPDEQSEVVRSTTSRVGVCKRARLKIPCEMYSFE